MDEGEAHRRRGERQCRGPRRQPYEDEEERQHRGDEELARGRPGKLERGVRAAPAGSKGDHPHLGGGGARRQPRRAEDAQAHLEHEHERERRQDARLVQHDRRRVDPGKLRDESEPPVPERERIARVQAAVLELVHGAQRERAEVVELPDAPEVEERVALDDTLEAPERDPERQADEGGGALTAVSKEGTTATRLKPGRRGDRAERRCNRARDEHEHECERQ